ncbi:MAG: hypothetical protein RIR00_885 [Pseudomonadota bacterium]|jgi:cytochrome c
MKAIYVAMMAVAGVALAGQAQADEALAKAKNCMSCHAVDKMVVGPAYKDVAKRYAGKKDAEATLADHIIKGTGPAGAGWQKEGKAALAIMPPNPTVNADEAKKLAKWVLAAK